MTRREELLEQLYQLCWNEMASLESDDSRYSYIAWPVLIKMDDICSEIERLSV